MNKLVIIRWCNYFAVSDVALFCFHFFPCTIIRRLGTGSLIFTALQSGLVSERY